MGREAEVRSQTEDQGKGPGIARPHRFERLLLLAKDDPAVSRHLNREKCVLVPFPTDAQLEVLIEVPDGFASLFDQLRGKVVAYADGQARTEFLHVGFRETDDVDATQSAAGGRGGFGG